MDSDLSGLILTSVVSSRLVSKKLTQNTILEWLKSRESRGIKIALFRICSASFVTWQKGWWSSCITVAEKSIKNKLGGIGQKLEVHERNSGEIKDILVDMTTLPSSKIKTLEVQ